MEITLRPL